MARAGGGRGAWGSLLLLILCSWIGPSTADPNPVRNLRAEAQNTSSITLRWEAPLDANSQNLTYWVQCTGDGINETLSTADTSVTVDGLKPGSLYDFWVWVEKNGVHSSPETLSAATAPNPVTNLRVEAQNTSSITLRWKAPQDADAQTLTYWVQYTGDGKNETLSTADTSITVDGLKPGSLYDFWVWVEKNGVHSSPETLSAATAPNPVTNLRAEAQNTSSITLRWEAPQDADAQTLTYWVQYTGDGKNETLSTADTSITVDGLKPGSLYDFWVWVEKNGVHSSPETLSAATAPSEVRQLKKENQTNNSVTLSWEAPADPHSQLYTYWVQRDSEEHGQREEDPTGGWANSTGSTSETWYIVGALEPGTLYNFSVWAEMNDVSSSTQILTASTAPSEVRQLKKENQTNNSVTLRWEAPADPHSQLYTYWVQWASEEHGQSEEDPTGGWANSTDKTNETWYIVGALEPGTLYNFSVWAEMNDVSSSTQILTASTAPSEVRQLKKENQTNNSVTLRWEAPADPHSQLYTYWVQWASEEHGQSEEDPTGGWANSTDKTNETWYIVGALEPGTLYNFSVWAEMNDVSSSTQILTASTAPSEVRQLKKENQTNNSVTLRWEAPADPHSQLYTYWVQWASEEHGQSEEDPTGGWANSTDKTSETWYIVGALEPGTLYNFSVWAEMNDVSSSTQILTASTAPDSASIISCVSISAGYGVLLTWSCPSGGYEAFEMEVGGQRSSQDSSSCGKGVSVSGLGPAGSYPATVTTVCNGLKAQPASVTCHTESAGVIAGAVMGVLLFLILVALLIFFLKKRNRNQTKAAPKDLVFSFPEDIPARNFANHVRENAKDSNYGFAEEYQQLSLEGYGQSQMVALAPENMAKNRYRNVLPYDWSRVPLQPLYEEPGSDYINASFVPGLWSSQEFIAAQGPLPQTVGDFWRLVWEQQSRTLVMLTSCVESGRVKCEHYWPLDAHPCTHGDLHVTLVKEEAMEHWAVRDLQLLHMKEQETLSVRQFHYLAWPDHGAPHSPNPLLAFWRMLRNWLDQTMEGGPPIVHCSAGVGRTGTFIALDVLLRQLQSEGVVGPFNFVRRMRESRPLMVQTEAQYVFLHQCILRFLQQSASAPTQEEPIYDSVADLIYENVAAIHAHDLEV